MSNDIHVSSSTIDSQVLQEEGTDMLGSRQSKVIMSFDRLPKADMMLIEVRTDGSGGGGIPKPNAEFSMWRANAQNPWSALPPQAYLGAV